MFLSFYLFGWLVVAGALVLWVVARDKSFTRIFPLVILAGLGAYLWGLGNQAAAADVKLQILFRDLMVIGLSSAAFSYLARFRKLAFALLAVTGMAFFAYYQMVLKPSFLPPVSGSTADLDEMGELLLELSPAAANAYRTEGFAPLNRMIDRYDLRVKPAFEPATPGSTDLDDYLLVDVPPSRTHALRSLQQELLRTRGVEWVEYNEVITVAPLKGEPLPETIRKKFGINDPGLEQLWGFDKMQMDELYRLLEERRIRPVKKALIAILDTGVDAGHEDLKANYRSVSTKYDNDPKGHGTHCAGIAGAVSNNGIGIASFSRDNSFAEITSIKVLSAMGYGSQKSIIDGIIEAADRGADVISLSLGGKSNDSRQKAYSQAVAYANRKSAIVVAAAGNSNLDARDFSPVNAKNVIGVSAVDSELNRAPFSNHVKHIKMGVAAPGVNIFSTIPNSEYATYNGTSMATPHVAGLLGLMKSLQPDLTTAEAYRILNEAGMPTAAGKETGKFIHPAQSVELLMKEKR